MGPLAKHENSPEGTRALFLPSFFPVVNMKGAARGGSHRELASTTETRVPWWCGFEARVAVQLCLFRHGGWVAKVTDKGT